jgi:hypothetical protein
VHCFGQLQEWRQPNDDSHSTQQFVQMQAKANKTRHSLYPIDGLQFQLQLDARAYWSWIEIVVQQLTLWTSEERGQNDQLES